MTAWRAELAGAFMLLTRLPVRWLARDGVAAPSRCVWAYPLAGAAVGGVAAGAYLFCAALGMGKALSALWALAASVLVTGGLHEDGLADTADGLGGGRTPERKLEIMRDSRIGSYGALALVLSTALRAAAVASLAQPASALVASGALARGGIVAAVTVLAPARRDGIAASLGERDPARVAVGLALSAVPALLLFPLPVALATAAAGAAAALAVVALARRQVGGYTGDVLGAVAVAVECVALALLSAWRPG